MRSRFVDILFFFFFSSRRRHTRLQGDWSSDVCSSDLAILPPGQHRRFQEPGDSSGLNHAPAIDRKSTRLSSSHLVCSYAVFCLIKKSRFRSEEHTSELQSRKCLVCRLLLDK